MTQQSTVFLQNPSLNLSLKQVDAGPALGTGLMRMPRAPQAGGAPQIKNHYYTNY